MNIINKKLLLFFLFGIAGGLAAIVAIARITWHGKYYPGVTVAGVDIGNLSRDAGASKVATAVSHYSLTLRFNGSTWSVPADIFTINGEETVNAAYRVGRRLNVMDYPTVATGKKTEFPLVVSLDDSHLIQWMDQITQTVEIPPVFARAEIEKGEITIVNGTDGVIVDRDTLRNALLAHARTLDTTEVEIPMRPVRRHLSESEIAELTAQAKSLLGDTLTLTQDDEKISLKQDTLVTFLVDESAVSTYVSSLATRLNAEPQDAKFAYEGGRVKEFSPSKDGITVQVDETTTLIHAALRKLTADSADETASIAVARVSPKITTENVNNLGIIERIGRGESYYAHSIANRVYNVGLASARVNGALVPPGEEFSFNKFVGEISGATGYKTAYVISGGRTVLGDGGGVCQVSTTLFRAAMNAGLPITERWAHAYRVGYYEQNSDPGIDATVYSPSKDFKFVNDTPGHILVQAINDPKSLHLVFEIYGTKDGRVATVTKPVVSGVSPPLPDIYEDDPNAPSGTVKQVDWAAWGAKASFDYSVVKADGTPLFSKTYVSNYRPWANVYLRGTAGEPVAAQ